MTRWIHLCFHQDYIIQQIQKHGHETVLVNFKGSNDEAVAAVKNDGVTWYPSGPCDKRGSDGKCTGHDEPVDGTSPITLED